MTVQDLILKLQGIDIRFVLGAFLAPLILTWIISLLHGRDCGNDAPWKYLYSAMVYLVCVPGIFSCIITGYSLFFLKQNLLAVNAAIYFLPIVSMTVTLILISRNADWTELPGVDRIYSLMIFISVSFIIALAVEKSRIWIVFGGSITFLILVALFCFALLKWSSYRIFRRKDDPKRRLSYYTDFHQTYEKELRRMKRNLRKK